MNGHFWTSLTILNNPYKHEINKNEKFVKILGWEKGCNESQHIGGATEGPSLETILTNY